MISPELLNGLMDQALREAQKAAAIGEVPVGAVFYYEDRVIASAHNLVETNHDASAHAEILVMREAAKVIGDWRLEKGILCVTLEPCTMCGGAIRLSRVGTVVFGARDPRLGAVGSLYDVCQDPRLGALPRVLSGVKERECGDLLSSFFAALR